MDSLGWTAEFRIPLSSCASRAGDDGEQVWGIEFGAHDRALRRAVRLGADPRDVDPRGLLLRRAARAAGALRPAPPGGAALQPWRSVTRAPGDGGRPLLPRQRRAGNVGRGPEVRRHLRPHPHATLNPDFGQVEADPSEVNLSAFETLLPGEAPLLRRGRRHLPLRHRRRRRRTAATSSSSTRGASAARRRATGRASGEYADRARADARSWARPSSPGRPPAAGRSGSLDAVTGRGGGAARGGAGGPPGRAAVEPLTNYSVVRRAPRLQRGQHAAGRGRHRDAPPPGRRRARLAALLRLRRRRGLRHRFGARQLGAHAAGCWAARAGSDRGDRRAQGSPAHYFQRPDADVPELGPGAHLPGRLGRRTSR